jgi:hypothetical protein
MSLRVAIAVLITLVLSACASPEEAGRPEPGPLPSAVAPELPSGWRWESYGGVQVGVPGDWSWADRALRLDAWCINRETEPPIVARPGAPVPLIACPEGENQIKNTGWLVGFGQMLPGDAEGVVRSGDRTTVRTAGVEVIVQVPAELRDRIVATVHRVDDVDAYGCPVRHPISDTTAWRPAAGPDVAALRDVTSISACRYGLGSPGSIISSVRLDRDAAGQALQGILRAPRGGGPDRPQDCLPEVALGDEAIVLRMESATGLSEIALRYDSCSGHGFDDGGTVRGLTLAAIAPFTGGANTVPSLEAQISEYLSPRPSWSSQPPR